MATSPFRPTEEELREGAEFGIDPHLPVTQFRMQLTARRREQEKLAEIIETCNALEVFVDEHPTYRVMAPRLNAALRERLNGLGVRSGKTIWVHPDHRRECGNTSGGTTWRINKIVSRSATSWVYLRATDVNNGVSGAFRASFVVQHWGNLVTFTAP